MRDKVTRRKLSEIDLGEFEFAPKRLDLGSEQRGEVDTKEELDLFKIFDLWIDAGRQPYQSDVETLRSVMRDPKYGDFFHEPQVAEVYRGMAVTREAFQELMGNKDINDLPESGWVEGEWVLRPRDAQQKFMSFSQSRQVAVEFAGTWASEKSPVHVVFSARISDNSGVFFDLYDMARKLDPKIFFVNVRKELEATAMGPVKIHKVSWMHWYPEASK